MLRGRQITVSDAVIVEVFGLPAEGPVWTNKWLKLQDAIEIFKEEGKELIIKGKGVRPSSVGEPWGELARVI